MTIKASSKLITDLKSIPSPVFYIFAAVALFSAFFVQGFSLSSVFTALFLLLLVACACGDINKGIVPDLLVILIAVLGVISFTVVEGVTAQGLINHLIGAVGISVPMFLIALLIKGAFGGGDIKLMAASGLYLGWSLSLAGALMAFLLSGLYGIYLLLFKKAKAKSRIKLAPFLAYGLAVAALFGEVIVVMFFS
jgi:leader peptidase (prepilin peptidase)/N-methyltransferase